MAALFSLWDSLQSSCAAQLIWRGFQRRTLGFAADKVTRYVAFLSGRCFVGMEHLPHRAFASVRVPSGIFYSKKRAAVRQKNRVQQLGRTAFCFVGKAGIIPASPAAPAHSRCSGICRWSSTQRSGRTPLQWRRMQRGLRHRTMFTRRLGGFGFFPCAQPCRFRSRSR